MATNCAIETPSSINGGARSGLVLDAALWHAAENLRQNVDAAEYRHVVLGLVFLRSVSDSFSDWRVNRLAQPNGAAEADDPRAVRPLGVFWVPHEARWDELQKRAGESNIASRIDSAMAALERCNDRLQGVLPKHYAKLGLRGRRLGELIRLVSTMNVCQQEPSSTPGAAAEVDQQQRDKQAEGENVIQKNGEQPSLPRTDSNGALGHTISFVKNEPVRLKDHPALDAQWVRRQIASEPSILGLGELVVKDREFAGSESALLLCEPRSNRHYEVALQLDETDERHLIRTIELWDQGRRRHPRFDHRAVLVAEELPTRLLHVMQLFNVQIPLIAVKMSALKVGDRLTLLFTTLLEEFREVAPTQSPPSSFRESFKR